VLGRVVFVGIDVLLVGASFLSPIVAHYTSSGGRMTVRVESAWWLDRPQSRDGKAVAVLELAVYLRSKKLLASYKVTWKVTADI